MRRGRNQDHPLALLQTVSKKLCNRINKESIVGIKLDRVAAARRDLSPRACRAAIN
jgi:hypothetical protein